MGCLPLLRHDEDRHKEAGCVWGRNLSCGAACRRLAAHIEGTVTPRPRHEQKAPALRHGTDAAVEIREWVSANCTRTFIPEAVLGVLGVEMTFADVLKRKEEEIW